ncbi:hypothetical protein [Aporhodopirellula aestuarii]|uniref:Glycosyltransferase RgtA/B/C/D-like domain-containing protein n=1 Tax=Aporhodopirellula aestuarii TaxID=2950107 RepID=A0ABT0U036_9BACT|nr:hypothetical protein [Aporhodopirellula aestuarii]MCM2370229.1 hypothetical protein [Aporhodopirellula aestuarii]
MMCVSPHHRLRLISISFLAVSSLVGWLIPDFYEWTDSDQSRPSPLLWQVPLGAFLLAAAICVALPWLPITSDARGKETRPPLRFGIRTLLLITTAVAIGLTLFAKFPVVMGGIVCAAMYAYFIGFWIRRPADRWAASSLLSCMILPSMWLISYDEPDRILLVIFGMLAMMPVFLPAMLVSNFLGVHIQDSQWIVFLLVAMELAMGMWVICLGPKRTIAYLLLVALTSSMGSLLFYQLIIA